MRHLLSLYALIGLTIALGGCGGGTTTVDSGSISTAALSGTVVELAHGSDPSIANNGWIAWFDASGIKLRHSGVTKVISKMGNHPTVNSKGQVAWSHTDGIHLWNGTRNKLIAPGGASGWSNYRPFINNSARIAFESSTGVRLWNGTAVSAVATNAVSPVLNAAGQLVFGQFGANYSCSTVLRAPNGTKRIIAKNTNDKRAFVNSRGWVVYASAGGGIFIWKPGGSVRKISTVSGHHMSMNTQGWVVWDRYTTNSATSPSQVYLYDGTKVYQLSKSAPHNQEPVINDDGWVAWWSYSTNSADPRVQLWRPTK